MSIAYATVSCQEVAGILRLAEAASNVKWRDWINAGGPYNQLYDDAMLLTLETKMCARQRLFDRRLRNMKAALESGPPGGMG